MADEQVKDQDGSQETPDETKPDLSQIVNSAISTHMKRLEKQFSKSYEEKIRTLEEKVTQLTQPNDTKSNKKDKNEENPELSALRSQFESMKSELSAARQRADELDKKRKEDQVFTEVRNVLGKHVRPETLDVLASYLFKASGKVEYDEDGVPLFKVRKAPHPGLAEEDVLMPLQDGIEAYLKTKEAAPYMPAPAATGNAPKVPTLKRNNSSSGPPKWETAATTPQERAERALQMEEYMKSKQA